MSGGSLRFMNKNISPREEKVTSPYIQGARRGVITPFSAALYSQEGARNFCLPAASEKGKTIITQL